jgi:hypothetical protein
VWDSGRKVVAALIEEDITNFATKDGTTFTGAVTVGNVLDITDTTDSSDATGDTGALRVEGGASIAKKLYVGTDLDVDGTANLDVVDIDGNLTIDGDVDLNGALDISGTAGSSNLQVTFAEGYKIYADNTTTGGGAANSRIWFEAPDNGEMVLGPRTGGHELHNMRLRATTIAAEGAINVTGLLTANGGLTIQDGDTFTFDTEALTDCIDSGETFTRSDTALATAGAIVDNFLQYDVDGGADQGATLYIQASEPYANGHSDGVKGDIWIDT